MAYSMSPPAQKPVATPYAPYQQASSPPAQSPYAPPPAKRQRLSPDVRPQANGSPVYVQSPHSLPATGYGNPYAQQPVQSPYSPSPFAGSPTGSFHTPQPFQHQHQQMPWSAQPQPPRQSQFSPAPPTSSRDMPPPPRPRPEDRDEKSNNIDDIGDSLFMSGINLKDEENYLQSTWSNRHGNDSFTSNQSTSFGSSTLTANNSFNNLTQGTSFGSQGQGAAFAGTMGLPRTQEQMENDARHRREIAARRLAESHQHHLSNQFLQGNCLRNRMHRLGTENAVRLDVAGVYLRNPEPEKIVMVNRIATEGVAVEKDKTEAKPESMIAAGVTYEHIISLISLATNERLRSMVDDAYGLARARQYGDHGRVVPPEFSDIADGHGKKSQETIVPENLTGSQWESIQDLHAENGVSQANSDKETPPVQTVSFQGNLNARLRELADCDRQAEKERAKKREARKRKAESAAGDENTPTDTPAETPAASGPVEAAAPSKMSKKEMNKKQKELQSTEAHSFNQSNQTAAMMAMGGKTKKYSWMSGGSAQLPTNRYAKNTASGTATPKAQAEPTASVTKAKEVKVPTWGDWREDGVDGKKIQMRDWVLVLERDGREKKALEKAVNKLQ